MAPGPPARGMNPIDEAGHVSNQSRNVAIAVILAALALGMFAATLIKTGWF